MTNTLNILSKREQKWLSKPLSSRPVMARHNLFNILTDIGESPG
jgi:hypothetical protein